MKLNRIQNLYLFKIPIVSILFVLLYSCTTNENNSNQPISKLYASYGFGSDLKYVEVNPESGALISTIFDPEPMEASINSDFTYFNTTNQLMFLRYVFDNATGTQLIKVDIDTKEVDIISSEEYSRIIAGNGKLFGFKRIFNNTLQSINLVRINPANASTISTMEIFETIESAPDNDETGITSIMYSNTTNQLLIPRRISFTEDAIDQLIKINANTGVKEIIPINHYEAMTIGNGRLFAIKRSYTNGILTFSGVVEVNINSGNEIDILKEFDLSDTTFNSEIIFLSNSNEIMLEMDNGTIYKININSGTDSIMNNDNIFYRFRSINIY